MDVSDSLVQTFAGFSKQVIAQMAAWPFYCDACANAHGANASIYAPYLHDAFYLYAIALSRTFNTTGRIDPTDYRNGTLIGLNSYADFQGQTGHVIIGTDGDRRVIYQLMTYDNLSSAGTDYFSGLVPYVSFYTISGKVVSPSQY